MKTYKVIFTEQSRFDLRQVRLFIIQETGFPRRAAKYVRRISSFCKELQMAPYRGEARVIGKPNLRTIGFEGRVSIVFEIEEASLEVSIAGIHYAGRDIAE